MDVERIAAELEIRELVARYATAVTARDTETWAATWTDDCEWYVVGRSAQGRQDAVALFEKLVSGMPFVSQQATDGQIRVDGDRATGTWQIIEHAKLPAGALLNLGTYDDQYVREDGVWRFAVRRFHMLYMGPPDLSGEPAGGAG